MKMAYVYVITNNISGKQYVGKTNKSIAKRFQQHCDDSRKEQCEKRPLYSAMNKYGIDNFSISMLEECPADESAIKEIYWIGRLDTYNNGYNATLGGDSKKYYDYQELANAYLKFGTLKRVAEEYGCDTHTVSFACKECGIEVLSSRKIHQKLFSKKVLMLDKKTEEILREFNSLMDAASHMVNNNLTGCKHSTIRTHISEVCNGKRKSAGGFKWCFKQ